MINWIPIEEEWPPRHEDVIALNSDGRIFRSRICAGLHEPFFTFPEGDKDASDTAPDWIDVLAWIPMPEHRLGTPANPHSLEKCKHDITIFKPCEYCTEEAGKGNRVFKMS